jgi:hypothetical protein
MIDIYGVEILLFDNRVLNESVEYTIKLPFNYFILFIKYLALI